MIGAERLPDGTIRAPVTVELEDHPQYGDVIGEGMADLKPGDPQYDVWDAWLKTQETSGA